MRTRWNIILSLSVVLPVAIIAIPHPGRLVPRSVSVSPASISQNDIDPVSRAQAVAINKAGFQYAPSLMGNASFHLGGTLGEQRIAEDLALWLVDRNIVNASLNADVAAANAAITAVGICSWQQRLRI